MWFNKMFKQFYKDIEIPKTKLIRPVCEPAKITSPWGKRILNGKENFHRGIDYINKYDTRRVLAITDGVVIHDMDSYKHELRFFDKKHSAGNMLIIKHVINGLVYYARYLHLGKNTVFKNEYVKCGQVIGYYGNFGYSFGAHLHFDMYNENWKRVNPTPILIMGLRESGVL